MNLLIKKALFGLGMLLPVLVHAQDVDLSKLLDDQSKKEIKETTEKVYSTFKSTRLISGHSVENTWKGVLDVRISHRFGTVNKGAYEFFGLDNATMRLGFDYGITNRLMVGVGRSTFQKQIDGFFKYKILWQSRGKHNVPVTANFVSSIMLQTLKADVSQTPYYFSSRLAYAQQLIIGRKFSESISLQLMPTWIHYNLVPKIADPNDLFAIGIGGRQKLSKHISINAEYYYQLPGYKFSDTKNALSVGFDLETGGHVFQLHFTNANGMTERSYITETKGSWGKGDILFGFTISRVFTVKKSKTDKALTKDLK